MESANSLVLFAFAGLSCACLAFNSRTSPINEKCVRTVCNESYTACMDDRICVDNVDCVSKCWAQWNSDTTPQKYHVQNCTTRCTTSFDDYIYDDAMKCLSEKGCIKFPSIPVQCKGPYHIIFQKNITLNELEGKWWNLRGFNPVYDCYPCQLNLFQSGSPDWSYKASYKAYYTDGSLKPVTLSGSAANSSSLPGFNVSVVNAGLLINSTWWVFDSIIDSSSGNTYYLVYYCGNSLEWGFEGALVLSATPSLSNNVAGSIKDSFQENVGLDFSSFCVPSLNDCSPPTYL